MDIILRADSARRAGIEVAEGAEQFVATLPEDARPANYRDDEFSLSPHLDSGGALHLYLNDAVSTWLGINNEHLVAALAGAPEDAPIVLHVNCPGGSVFAARAMQATLAGRRVEARIEGLAASAASWLILCAERRTITVGSRVAVHEVTVRFSGSTSELAERLPVLRAMDVEISEDYGRVSSASAADWLRLMAANQGAGTEFGAARALELGIVHEVVDTIKGARNEHESTRVDDHLRGHAAARLAVRRRRRA